VSKRRFSSTEQEWLRFYARPASVIFNRTPAHFEELQGLIRDGFIVPVDTEKHGAHTLFQAKNPLFSPRKPKKSAKKNPQYVKDGRIDKTAYAEGLAKSREIGIANAETAIDQRKAYPSVRAAYAGYLVNTVDTVREHRLPSPEAAVEAFLVHIAKPRKRRK
jgi:hypothetical protein